MMDDSIYTNKILFLDVETNGCPGMCMSHPYHKTIQVCLKYIDGTDELNILINHEVSDF